MRLKLDIDTLVWPMHEPFTIARGTMDHVSGVLVTLTDEGGLKGRGEAYGITYEDETPESLIVDIERARAHIEGGIGRKELLDLMSFGGGRFAVDSALWDLEAKQQGVRAYELAGMNELRPVDTVFTIGMKPVAEMAAAANKFSAFKMLKVKVDAGNPLDILEAIHASAPDTKLIVDPNQSWDFDLMQRLMPDLIRLNVALLEQPLPVDGDAGLLGYESPIPVCADELIHDRTDLPKAEGKYQVINIKLDKSGGLTEGLALAQEALAQNYRLMVGCMAGSSLAMAPGTIIAQLCDYVDLDGPLLQSTDWPHAMTINNGLMSVPVPDLWG